MAKSITVTFTDDEYRCIKSAAAEEMITEVRFIIGAALMSAAYTNGKS